VGLSLKLRRLTNHVISNNGEIIIKDKTSSIENLSMNSHYVNFLEICVADTVNHNKLT